MITKVFMAYSMNFLRHEKYFRDHALTSTQLAGQLEERATIAYRAWNFALGGNW